MCTSSAYYEKATLDKIFYQKGVYGGVCLHDCMLFDNFFCLERLRLAQCGGFDGISRLGYVPNAEPTVNEC